MCQKIKHLKIFVFHQNEHTHRRYELNDIVIQNDIIIKLDIFRHFTIYYKCSKHHRNRNKNNSSKCKHKDFIHNNGNN
jgi:hypothetical protein